MKATQRLMFGHGALILLVGMAGGIGLLVSLLGGVELVPGHVFALPIRGSPDAWGRLHGGGMMNGMLILLVALLIPSVGFSEARAKTIAWMLVGTGWANTLFYWAALFAPNRALTFGDNRFGHTNWAAVVGLGPALVFAIISLVAVAMVARQAFAMPNAPARPIGRD